MSNRRKPIEAGEGSVKRSIRYLRVSSKKQMDTDFEVDPEGNSIDTQRKVTIAKERELGLVNVGEYVEPGNSAQTIEKRPVFREMIARITKERDVDYVIIYARSRAFRNYIDAGNTKMALAKLGVKLISAKEDFGDGLMAEAMEAVTDVFNWLQVRMSGEDIKVKMANKARNGGTVGRAKVGYLNVRKRIEGREVRTIETDPERAQFIAMAFEAFATGKYTIDSLQVMLTQAGLRMQATARRPARPISLAQLGDILRDRYYLGYVQYEGIEYPGRHEALISPELFERVQKVLNSHSGAGTRTRTHNHYLKGVLWCARCEHRFVLTPGRGNGGEYFYFFCRGRQEGLCDAPYLNVHTVEQAVLDHYATVDFSEEFREAVRARLDQALETDLGSSQAIRARLAARLAALDVKEDNLLDLAADGDLPKERIREKLIAIRDERASVRRDVESLDAELETGRQVFGLALDLLDQPQELYRQAGSALRKLMNQTIFTKLKLDSAAVAADELAEPFDVIVPAGRTYSRGGYQRKRPPVMVAFHEGVWADELTSTDLLELALGGKGSNKDLMVELRGFEPLTPSMRTRCATGLRYSPENLSQPSKHRALSAHRRSRHRGRLARAGITDHLVTAGPPGDIMGIMRPDPGGGAR